MGKMIYGSSGIEIVFDDRALAHLQVVIGAKLRRRESFFFSWVDENDAETGRSSLWLDRSIPLYFTYVGGELPELNREWVRVLTNSANSSGGLQFVPEPPAAAS